MIKKFLLITLALVVMALAVGISPRQALAADNTWHYNFVGLGAEAGFSDCNYWPVPAGTLCTDTYISVAEQVYKENGSTNPSTSMWVSQYQYKVDWRGNYILVMFREGWGEASLNIKRNLASASASSTLQMSTCTVDRRGNYTCQESLVPVSATWSGVGDVVRNHGNSHTVSKGYTYSSHFKGSTREAIAQVSGLQAVGEQYWASIYNSRWMYVYINHGAK